MATDRPILHGDILLATSALETGTYGSDAAPTNAQAFDAHEIKLKTVIDHKKRKRVTNKMGDSRGSVPGIRHYEYEFEAPVGGPPDPGGSNPLAEPSWGRHLQAAGWVLVSTGTPTDTHTYTLYQGGAQESLTYYFYRLAAKAPEEYELRKVTGAANQMGSLTAEAGEQIMLGITGKGLYNAPIIQNPAGEASGYDDDAAVAINMVFTLAGQSFVTRSLELSSPYEVKTRKDGTAPTGIRGFHYSKGADGCFVIKFVYEQQVLGDYDHEAAALVITDEALVWQINTANGSRIEITASTAQRGPFEAEPGDGCYIVTQEIFIKGSDLTITVTRP